MNERGFICQNTVALVERKKLTTGFKTGRQLGKPSVMY